MVASLIELIVWNTAVVLKLQIHYLQINISCIFQSILKMKQPQFIDTYLRVDDGRNYVLQSISCPLLGGNNYCSIYDVRTKARSEFSHTDRRKFTKSLI